MSARPLATDELPDRILFRPLAALLVKPLVHTPVTPNQLTVGAALCGIGAGVAAGLQAPVAFAVLMVSMMVLDCADGQLARLRGGGDIWGRIADGVGDYLTATALHVGLIVWVAQEIGWPQALLWGVAAGALTAWGAQLMDKYKRRYRGDLDDVEAIRATRDGARGIKRFLVSAFLPYAVGMNQGPSIPDPEAYRERTRPAMALWLWLGPTTHYTLAAVLGLLGKPLLYLQLSVLLIPVLTLAVLLLQRWLQARSPAVVTAAAGSPARPA